MSLLFIIPILTLSLFAIAKSEETTCADSQRHFANLCFPPKPLLGGLLNRTEASQPPLYGVLGNDVLRLHIAEGLKGELLQLGDNYDDICTRVKVVYKDNSEQPSGGIFYGFGNLSSNWSCTYSSDFPGVLLCDNVNPGVTEYHENFNYYSIQSVNNNILLGVYCFPNGQVGWSAFSKDKTITDADKAIVTDRIISLGFSDENTVPMYNEEICSRNK